MVLDYLYMGVKYLVEPIILCFFLGGILRSPRESLHLCLCALPLFFLGALVQDGFQYLWKAGILDFDFTERYLVANLLICVLFCRFYLKVSNYVFLLTLMTVQLLVDICCQYIGTYVVYCYTDILVVSDFRLAEQLVSTAVIDLLLIPSLLLISHSTRGIPQFTGREATVIVSTNVLLFCLIRLLKSNYLFSNAKPELAAVVYFFFLLISLAFFLLMTGVLKEKQANLEQTRLTQHLNLQMQHTQEVETIYQKLRELRHEMKNQQIYILHLLESKQYDALMQYYSNQEQLLEPLLQMYDSGNVLVNSILQAKLNYANSLGISMIVDAAVPEQLPIKGHHLCSILVNLLDNAIEASQGMKAPEIRVQIQQRKGYLFCCIANRIDQDVLAQNPTLHTTKEDADSHGFGIQSIRLLCQQYGGILDIQVEKNYFVASIMLQA